jgi:hypothetical protein
MNLQQPLDLNVYRLAQRLLGMPKREGEEERRNRPRESYRAVQRIAPFDGQDFPPDTEFFPVRCHDITGAGLGFLLPTRPQFKMFVIALGAPPREIYVAGKVVHVTDVLLYTSGRLELLGGENGFSEPIETDDDEAMPMVLVGCEMTGRLEKPTESEIDL